MHTKLFRYAATHLLATLGRSGSLYSLTKTKTTKNSQHFPFPSLSPLRLF